MNYELNMRAICSTSEKSQSNGWKRVLVSPALVEPAESDLPLENRFGRIVEFGNRVLRVVVNTTVVPERVVSVYFDRRMRNNL